MHLTLAEIASITGGRAVGRDAVVSGFAFDSRSLSRGEGFAALRDLRDGHDFVGDAFARGAALALVERVPRDVDGALVVVADVRRALLDLARAVRERLPDAAVIGITGSAGKTSTKDLTAAAIGAALRVHASAASFNNEIGLPITLLGAPPDTEALVLEMGARFAGNITELCAIARPGIGVITHIGLAHAEHLGGRGGVARVKGELLEALPADGLAVLNAECEHTAAQRSRTAARVVTVGIDAVADVRVSEVRVDAELRATFRLDSPWGTAPEVSLAVRGEHQVLNAAQAATVALHLGVAPAAVVAALGGAGTADWRMQLGTSPAGVLVLNDAYNASPTAVAAALDALGHLDPPGRRIAVLGEMLELGAAAPVEHARVGELAAASGVDLLIAVGPGAAPIAHAAATRGVEVRAVADAEAAAAVVLAVAEPGDAVLVKASRAVGLERVAEALLAGRVEVAP